MRRRADGRMEIKGVFFIAAVLLAALIPYGCSRAKNQAPAPAVAQQPMEPGREHFTKGVQLMLKGLHDDAIREFQETLKYNPSSAETYNNIGFEYMDKGDIDRAIENQNRALQLNPKLAYAYYGLAEALEKKGDKGEALKNWNEFLKLAEPHTRWWMSARAHIQNLEKK